MRGHSLVVPQPLAGGGQPVVPGQMLPVGNQRPVWSDHMLAAIRRRRSGTVNKTVKLPAGLPGQGSGGR